MIKSLNQTAEYSCVLAIPMPRFHHSVDDMQFADDDNSLPQEGFCRMLCDQSCPFQLKMVSLTQYGVFLPWCS